MIGPEDAWAQLSASLSVIELVVVGDMLITGSSRTQGRLRSLIVHDLPTPYGGTGGAAESARSG